MIEIIVDLAKCQHYGQCVFEAPDVFELTGDNVLNYRPLAESTQLAELEGAVDVCPMQAISLRRTGDGE